VRAAVGIRGEPDDHDGRVGGVALAVAWVAGEVRGEITARGIDVACTSRAAPLMWRFSSNCREIRVLPIELDDVISVTPATWLNWRSSGVATEEAMTSALAPGRPAETEMVGKSTCGSGETGSTEKPAMPAMATAAVSSVVATGL